MMPAVPIGIFIIILVINEFVVGMIIYCSPEPIQAHIFIIYVRHVRAK